MAAVVGLVVGAVGVGLPWLLSGSGGSGGSDGLGGSSGSITAPGRLGDLMPFAQASARYGNGKGAANAQQFAADDAQSTTLLSAAYGGASALVARYADGSLQNMAQLFVVRANTPQPYTPYENLKELGQSVPLYEVRAFGDVRCLIYNTEPQASGPEPTDGVATSVCQRSDNGLTVQVKVSGDIQHHPDQVAALVDDAWSSLT